MKPKLIIVTDLGLLKAYRLEATRLGTPRLVLLEEVVLEDAHHRLVDQVTDLSGRRVSPTARQWGTPLADDHNLKREIKRRLIRTIAGHLRRLVKAHPELTCCVAAPREIHHLVLDALPQSVRARIETSLARDLVKATRKELVELFTAATAAPKPRPAVASSNPA